MSAGNISIKIMANINKDNIDIAEINEQIKRLEKKVEKIKLKIEPSQIESVRQWTASFSKFQETRRDLEKTINTVFPNVDSKKLLNLLIDTPLRTGVINLYLYDKFFELLIDNYSRSGQSELPSTLVVRNPTEENDKPSIISSGAFKTFLNEATKMLLSACLSIGLGNEFSNAATTNQLLKTERTIVEHVELIKKDISIQRNILIENQQLEEEQNKRLDDLEEKINKLLEMQEKELNAKRLP